MRRSGHSLRNECSIDSGPGPFLTFSAGHVCAEAKGGGF